MTVARYDVSPIGLKKNWVTGVGGLPLFIRAIAHALIRAGHSESQAIQMAVGVVKNWASGEGHVTAKTRAKAAAALAEWEAKKAASHGASRGAMMADSKKMPYGNVEYADPGYQKDGKKRYPLDTAEHARAAWSYINQGDNASQYTPEQLARVRAKIMAACKKFGIEVADASRSDVMADDAPSPLQVFGSRMITRAYDLEDIHIKPGTGRTVEAYATVFNTEAEIMDPEGHYIEVNDPNAFDKQLQRMGGVYRVGVFYNHGKTLHGKSSEAGSVPLGRPELIRADRRGLLTVTEYNKTQLADDILEAIKSGSITAQSYTGPVFRSDPTLSRSQRRRGGYAPRPDGTLQTVRRMELGIFEYGPTPIPAYEDAAVVGVRAQQYRDFSDEDQDDVPDESELATAERAAADLFRRRLQAAMRARGI